MNDDQVISLVTCSYSRAVLIRSRLETEGIPSFITNVNMLQPDIGSGVQVWIRSDDFAAANRILEETLQISGVQKEPLLRRLRSFRRILVPVDFSECSETACMYAIGIAHRLNASIRLVNAYYNPVVGSDPVVEGGSFSLHLENIIQELREEVHRKILELRKKLRSKAEEEFGKAPSIGVELDRGTPEQVILSQLESYRPGLMVMGTRGENNTSGPLLGSVTRRVIQNAGVPVLAVPEKAVYWGMKYIKRLLYATNFDANDLFIIRQLIALTRPFNMSVHCVHIETSLEDRLDQERMILLRNQIMQENEGLQLTCSILLHQDVVQGLQEYIEKNDIDIVALTTHKRNIIERFFNPGITKKMLFHSHIPLLVFQS